MKQKIIIASLCVALIGCGGTADKALEILGSLLGGFASAFLSDLGGGGGDSSEHRIPDDTQDRHDDGAFIYDDKGHYKGTYEEDNNDNPDTCAEALGDTVPSTITISDIDDVQLLLPIDDSDKTFTLAQQDELDMYIYEFEEADHGCIAAFASRSISDDEWEDILVLYCEVAGEAEKACNMLFVKNDN